MSSLDDYIDLVDYLAKQNAQDMILKLTNIINGGPVTPARAEVIDWKAHLEAVQAELAEHLTSEAFTAIAKRPAYKAAMAAREGKPAKGPPRVILKYKKIFTADELIDVPFSTVEPINGKLVVTFLEIPGHTITRTGG